MATALLMMAAAWRAIAAICAGCERRVDAPSSLDRDAWHRFSQPSRVCRCNLSRRPRSRNAEHTSWISCAVQHESPCLSSATSTARVRRVPGSRSDGFRVNDAASACARRRRGCQTPSGASDAAGYGHARPASNPRQPQDGESWCRRVCRGGRRWSSCCTAARRMRRVTMPARAGRRWPMRHGFRAALSRAAEPPITGMSASTGSSRAT